MTKWKPGEFCHRCQNTGEVACHCGGDLCVCENYGEAPCPWCGGASVDYPLDGYWDDDVGDVPQ